MKTFGKFLAGVCAILFVLTGVFALFLFNVEWKAFSAGTYKQAFKEQGLYEDAPTLIAGMLTETAQEETDSEPSFLSVLGRDGLETVIASLVPPDQLEALTDSILDAVFAFLNGESDSITVSLAPLKQNLTGEAGVQVFMQVLSASPDCTPEQVLEFALGSLSTEDGLIFCKPPEEAMALVAPLIESQIQSMMRGIPDEIALPLGAQERSRQFIERLNRIRTLMQLSLLVPIVFLLLILIFAIRNLNEWLTWWAIPFVITGGLSALLALIGAPFIRLVLDFAFQQGTSEMPAVFLDLMPDMAGSLAKQILRPLAIEGIILAVIGVGMLVALRFRNRAALAADIANG
jgi:hypothetical protein